MSPPIVFGSSGWAWGTLGAGAALLSATLIHATLTAPGTHEWLPAPVRDAIRRTGLADLCLTPHEDLRHPAWARDEQSLSSSPSLRDPRAARWFVRPVPWRVVR